MRHRGVVAVERSIGRQRRTDVDDARVGELLVAFVQLDQIGEPLRRCIVQRAIGARQVERAVWFVRPVDVVDRGERHADRHEHPVPLGLDECLNRDVVGDFVGDQDAGAHRGEHQDSRDPPALSFQHRGHRGHKGHNGKIPLRFSFRRVPSSVSLVFHQSGDVH